MTWKKNCGTLNVSSSVRPVKGSSVPFFSLKKTFRSAAVSISARDRLSMNSSDVAMRAEIDSAAERNVFFRLKNGTELPFTGRTLLLTFSVPQFFFHVTTSYDLLRHAGVELVKRDFLGPRER